MNEYKMTSQGLYVAKHDIIVPRGKLLIIQQNIHTGAIIKDVTNNMFLTAGKNSLANAIRGVETENKGIITYCAVGTGLTAPALTDTQLQTELFRKLISVRTTQDNTAIFQTFFTASEAIGTLREAGLFGDNATATADSGTIFCRAAINRIKSSNDTLTIYWYVTIG